MSISDIIIIIRKGIQKKKKIRIGKPKKDCRNKVKQGKTNLRRRRGGGGRITIRSTTE